MIRPHWLILLLATSVMMQSCGKVEVPLSCTSTSVAESSPLSDSLDIMINIDGSQSMLGYVNERNSRYVQTLKLLDDTLSLSSLRSQTNPSYYRSGNSINRSDFKKAQLPLFYNNSDSKFPNISVPLQEFILTPKQQDSLLVMVTDLDQADGDVTIVNQKIKNTYLNQNNQDYVVGIWGIKSEFSGTVHVQERGTIRKFTFPNAQSTDDLRPFYVIFMGRYDDIINYFKAIEDQESELVQDSQFTLFSPYKFSDNIAYLNQEPVNKPAEETVVLKQWRLESNIAKVQAQDKNNQLWEISSQQTQPITIPEDSVNLILNSQTADLNSNTISVQKNIQILEELSRTFKDVKEVYGDTSVQESLNIEQWEVVKNSDGKPEQLKFSTIIDPSKFPNAGLYFFNIDVILKSLPEENWWQDWSWQAGRDNPEDGSKTHNLLTFMRGLKTITTNLMVENPPVVGRFCYGIHKK